MKTKITNLQDIPWAHPNNSIYSVNYNKIVINYPTETKNIYIIFGIYEEEGEEKIERICNLLPYATICWNINDQNILLKSKKINLGIEGLLTIEYSFDRASGHGKCMIVHTGGTQEALIDVY